jgi:hypothetical protein
MENLYERALECLDAEEGVNEKVYTLLMDLILAQYGEAKAAEFSRQVNATDGCFYLRRRIDGNQG